MMPGVFFPFDVFGLVVLTILYFCCPTRFFGKKYDYVKFFLCFLSLLFCVVFAYKLLENPTKETVGMTFWTLFCPILCLSHLVYPFRTAKRSRHITFFSLLISLFELVEVLAIWSMVVLSDM